MEGIKFTYDFIETDSLRIVFFLVFFCILNAKALFIHFFIFHVCVYVTDNSPKCNN